MLNLVSDKGLDVNSHMEHLHANVLLAYDVRI